MITPNVCISEVNVSEPYKYLELEGLYCTESKQCIVAKFPAICL